MDFLGGKGGISYKELVTGLGDEWGGMPCGGVEGDDTGSDDIKVCGSWSHLEGSSVISPVTI